MVNLKRMQDRQLDEIIAKKDKQTDGDRNEKSSVQVGAGEDNQIIQLSKENEKALVNAITSQENKLNQLQKRINKLAAAFNVYQETAQGNIDETLRTFAEKAGNRATELLNTGAKVENGIRELIEAELKMLLDALNKAVKEHKENLRSVSQEEQKQFSVYLEKKMQDYQNRRQWSETLNHIARRWYWYVWFVVIVICSVCLGLVNSCSRANEREENARLWIEKGRLWEYYRENNPKTSTKLIHEYYKTHKKFGEK